MKSINHLFFSSYKILPMMPLSQSWYPLIHIEGIFLPLHYMQQCEDILDNR